MGRDLQGGVLPFVDVHSVRVEDEVELGMAVEAQVGEVQGDRMGQTDDVFGLVVVDGLVDFVPLHAPFLQVGNNRELGGVLYGGGIGMERAR